MIGVIKLKNGKMTELLKVFAIFIIYLIYNSVFQAIFTALNIHNGIITMFTGDVLFLIGMIALYYKDLKESLDNLDKSKRKFIGKVVIGVVLLFAVNMIVGMISEVLVPSNSISDDNTTSIYNLSQISFVYTLFKTMVFGVIAEELLFKQSLRKVIPNNVLFVISSSLIYAVMNVIYGDLSSPYLLTDALSYFAVSATLATMYIKNQDSIILVMFIKFFYNLIPMCIMIAGMF